MPFSAVENIELLTQPVLLVVGSKADSDWQTQRFMRLMPGNNKQIFKVEGATHIDLYDTTPTIATIEDFFKQALKGKN